MTHRPSTCADVRAAVPLYVGDDLDLSEQAQVKTHLADCEECRLVEDRARQARRALVVSLELEASAEMPSVWEGVRADLLAHGLIGEGHVQRELAETLLPRPRSVAAGPRPAPVSRFQSVSRRLQLAGFAAAAGLLFTFGMIHFFGESGSSTLSAPLDSGTVVDTRSAVHEKTTPGALRLVGKDGVPIHESALELVPEQWLIVPRTSGSTLARNPGRPLPDGR